MLQSGNMNTLPANIFCVIMSRELTKCIDKSLIMQSNLGSMEKVSEFAQLVTCFRQERGMSQGQLAHATRLSRTYIYHLETGQRANPSPQVVQNIVRALELASNERQHLFEAYTALTGQFLDQEQIESTLLDMGELASLLVHNTSYPAHSLDRLWFLHSWNDAAIMLFEVWELVAKGDQVHLLSLVFDPQMRRRFHEIGRASCRE